MRGVRRASKEAVLKAGVILLGAAIGLAGRLPAQAYTLTIQTIGGPISIELSHLGPSGGLEAPPAPIAPSTFKPPSIFSAPVPSGSGARALGFAGAFTAVADDATAASWNPAGLVQLERPEASVVLRVTRNSQEHASEADDFRVGTDEFGDAGLNYFSVAYPLRVRQRNVVCSFNVQEAYNFNQAFSADIRQSSRSSSRRVTSASYSDTQVQHVNQGNVEADITTHLTTRKTSTLREILDSEALSELDFEQDGIVDAITPAVAFEVNPRLSFGAALNLYQASLLTGGKITSRTKATYDAKSSSAARVTDESRTSGTWSYAGIAHLPPGGGIPFPIDVPISGSGSVAEFADSNEDRTRRGTDAVGVYEEENEFAEFNGFNATVGGLWTVSRYVSLGFSVDLPWTAEAEQTKTSRNTVTTYDAGHTRVLGESSAEQVETKDVEFDFPLSWAVGSVVRFTDRFYTSLDLSRTYWSQFSYKADGEERVNPLDGSLYDSGAVDDCWAVRAGAEYLVVLARTEIPLRGGVCWEQRPAVGEPDEYWGVSVGSGISIGRDPGRLILDVAYSLMWGNDVLGSLVPGQEGLKTDVVEQQVYASGIWHF